MVPSAGTTSIAVPGPAPIGVGPDGRLRTDNNRYGTVTDRSDCDRDRLTLSLIDNERYFRDILDDANRGNASFYTIDPRGLVAGQDIDDEVNAQDFHDWVRDSQTTLRVMAEETGGSAIVNQNDFDRGLERIDAETSDYYLLGFVSSNPDPLKRSRKVEVKVRRADVTPQHRQGYTLTPSR